MGKYKQNKMVHHIRIETVPNGYTMDVDGNGFMYYTLAELIEGVFTHIGLGIVDYCDEKTMRDLMTACALWPNEGDAIKAVAGLEAKVQALEQSNQRQFADIAKKKATIASLNDELARTKKRLSYYISADEKAKKKAKKGETEVKSKSTMIHKADIQVNVPKKIIKVKPGPPIDKPAKVERRGRPPKQATKTDDHEELEKRLREKGVLK